MAYLSNEPGTQLTPDEILILNDLVPIGLPFQMIQVDPTGSFLEYVTVTLTAGEFLEASQYNKNAIGGILISSQYSV